jgi:hypothetical protein
LTVLLPTHCEFFEFPLFHQVSPIVVGTHSIDIVVTEYIVSDMYHVLKLRLSKRHHIHDEGEIDAEEPSQDIAHVDMFELCTLIQTKV